MGVECLLCSYGTGLLPLTFGLQILITGRVYLSLFSKEPAKGAVARLLGCLILGVAVAYYVTISWAWSFYDC
jgi:hypothetical protein